MSRPKGPRRRLRSRKGGFPGRCCSSCKDFLPASRADHYCQPCRNEQRRKKKREAIERDPRFYGGELANMLSVLA